MRDHGILVIRGQDHVGDDEHIRFSEAFGPLELPPVFGKAPTRFRPELYDASNLDESGEIAPADSLRHKFSRGNELFHSDSSFNEKPTKWSLLFCHIPAPERGETEFVDGRAVYAALPEAMKARLDGMTAEHNFWISRERGGYPQPEAMKVAVTPAIQPVVRTSESGAPTLFVGAHLHRFVGLDEAQSDALLDELLAFASQPRFVYRHVWRPATCSSGTIAARCTGRCPSTISTISVTCGARRSVIHGWCGRRRQPWNQQRPFIERAAKSRPTRAQQERL